MIEFRRTKNSLFLILMLHFTAATGQRVPRFIVRGGDEVTLPCGHTIDDQSRCGEIDWIFSIPGGATTVRLFEKGQTRRNEDVNRLSETETCSLVIKKVTVKDAGFYTCRQFTPGLYRDANVYLFVITMTERRDPETVELSFTLLTHGYCEYRLRWLYVEQDEDVETSHATCKVTVKFPATYLDQESKCHQLFRCEVIDSYNEEKKKQFDFSPQSSGEDATTAATVLTMGTTVNRNKTRMDSAGPAVTDTPTAQSWWLYITVAAGSAALLIVVVAVVIWKRTKRKKTQMDENTGQTLDPAVTAPGPETSQDEADPEDGVSYASVSYTKTNSKAQVQVKHDDDDDDDEGDTVTYSAVKASSRCARDSDPSSLYGNTSMYQSCR